MFPTIFLLQENGEPKLYLDQMNIRPFKIEI